MALVATIGAADANSYVTVEEAEAYFADRLHADGWIALEAEDKSKILVTASRQLDWYAKWKGYVATDIQSMSWPRVSVVKPDESTVPSDIIPNAVKAAVYELALSSIDTDRTSDSDMAGLAEIKAGSVMLKADDGLYNTKPKAVPLKIWKILSDYTLRSGNNLVRLVRA